MISSYLCRLSGEGNSAAELSVKGGELIVLQQGDGVPVLCEKLVGGHSLSHGGGVGHSGGLSGRECGLSGGESSLSGGLSGGESGLSGGLSGRESRLCGRLEHKGVREVGRHLVKSIWTEILQISPFLIDLII